MIRISSTRAILGVCALAVGLLAGPQTVHGDAVDDAQRKVNQVLDELDQLRDEMGQVDEDYNGALDRQDELVPEIAASQARVDEMTAVLGDVQIALQQIALDRFTSGDSMGLSPIFSNAATYSAAGQRSALATLALDTGEGNVDDLQSLVDDLAAERASLARKQEEQAQLIATLEAKQVQMAEMEKDYLARYAKAERDLGKAEVRAAEQAREAAAAKRDQMRRAADAKALASIPRGAGAAPRYTGAVPEVSGSAGIAVAAAYSQIGVPYIAFAAAPGTGFDCSGLTQWVWGRAGVSLPHQSGRQFASTPSVPQDQVQPGDLIYYYAPISHVGIYVGGGQMIHAPAPGKFVGLTTVNWNKVIGISRPG
ncbi:MAG: C40 family peptidase [Actinobacteria bacterium]|nr:C40 family peptidase [Actinomycetota bacterium]